MTNQIKYKQLNIGRIFRIGYFLIFTFYSLICDSSILLNIAYADIKASIPSSIPSPGSPKPIRSQSATPNPIPTSTKTVISTVSPAPSPNLTPTPTYSCENVIYKGFPPCNGTNPCATPTPWFIDTPLPKETSQPTSPIPSPRPPTNTPTIKTSSTPNSTPTPYDCDEVEPGCYYNGLKLDDFKKCIPSNKNTWCEPETLFEPMPMPDGYGTKCQFSLIDEVCELVSNTVLTSCNDDYPTCSDSVLTETAYSSCSGCWTWKDRISSSEDSKPVINCSPSSEPKEIQIALKCLPQKIDDAGGGEDGYVIVEERCSRRNEDIGDLSCAGSCTAQILDSKNNCLPSEIFINNIDCGAPTSPSDPGNPLEPNKNAREF